MQIHSVATPNSCTLYWEREAQPQRVRVLVDGAVFCETEKTHITVPHLAPDTDLTVCLQDQTGAVLGQCAARTLPARWRLDVRDYGAVGDGVSLCTQALQRALDDCTRDCEVYIPAGTYLTGALTLHSGVAMYLEKGAVLQGTDQPEDYLPRIRTRFEGMEGLAYQSLLNAGTLDHTAAATTEDILLYGEGEIAGGGWPLAEHVMAAERERLQEYLAENAELVASCESEDTIPGRVRPRLIEFCNCRRVRITGLTCRDSSSWMLHMIYCQDVVTDHVFLHSRGIWNGDGWDPDSSERCVLFASRLDTGDDGVAIKSGKNPEGNAIARPCRDIWVFDCVSDFGLGVAIGSEISGGVERVHIWDCDLSRSEYGIQIKATAKRGAYVRDIQVHDCVLPKIVAHAVSYNDDGAGAPHPPIFEKFYFSRLRITGQAMELAGDGGWTCVTPIELTGFDTPGYAIRECVFTDCTITGGDGTLRLHACEQVSFQGVCAGIKGV